MRKLRLGALTAGLLLLATMAMAELPGPHPAYRHAASNLQVARDLLSRESPDYRADELAGRAIHEIDGALVDCRNASLADDKDLRHRPPADLAPAPGDRLMRALDLLNAAFNDVSQPEANRAARGIQGSALHHIDEARRAVTHAIDLHHHDHFDPHMPPPPPDDRRW